TAPRGAGMAAGVVPPGQPYRPELSQVFSDELGLAGPRPRLGLQTSDPKVMRLPIHELAEVERPDWVLVYGDTNSTLAGARAAESVGVPLAHVEAGLRSGDLSMPEEHNRIEVDRIAALVFAPDERPGAPPGGEGVGGRVEVVGDVMYDALRLFLPIALDRSTVLESFEVEPYRYVLVTLHREANVHRRRLRRIVEGLNRLEETIVFPAHPRTRRALSDVRRSFDIADPLGYLDFAALASQARVIVTDSGGLQKEAYWYGVPCVTTRPSTEWVDTVEVGANELVDDDPERIEAAVKGARMPRERPELYGSGYASEQIAKGLLGSLSRA